MFIQTERTPNPETLKFLPGCEVTLRGSVEFRSLDEARGKSPLAEKLFGLGNVIGVFLGRDFISVTKAQSGDWEILSPLVLAAVMDHFTSGAPVLINESESTGESNDSEIVKQIKEILETRVRPAVAQDGGDIVFDSFEDGILYLQLQGACQGCPSSTATLKNGIENLMRHYVPEVEEVRAID